MPSARVVGAAALLVALGLLPALAAAAPSTTDGKAEEAAAEAAFQRGLADMLAGRYGTGCPSIAESLRLDRRPGTLFTLAECERQAGLLASAHGHYQEFLDMVQALPADRRGRQQERERIALRMRDQLAPRVPSLLVRLTGEVAPGTLVTRDGVAVAAPLWGTAVPVDPGAHQLQAQEPGGAVTTLTVTVAEGEHREVDLQAPSPAPAPAPAPAEPTPLQPPPAAPVAVDISEDDEPPPPPAILPPPPPAPEEMVPPAQPLDPTTSSLFTRARDERARRLRRWGGGLAATGAALALAGGIALVVAKQKVDAINDAAGHDRPYDPANSNYPTYEATGYALLGTGGAAVIGGLALYLAGRPQPAKSSSAALIMTPILSLGPDATTRLSVGVASRF